MASFTRSRSVANRSQRQQPAETSSEAFRQAYAALGHLGLSYELNASPGGLLAARELARAHPEVPIVVGHAGMPLQRDSDYFRTWASEMAGLATVENIVCKISGLGQVDHSWSVESLRPWVLKCIEMFGVERSMFGTNWPVDLLYASYAEQVDAYRLILEREGFSPDDQGRLLHGTAEHVYRI